MKFKTVFELDMCYVPSLFFIDSSNSVLYNCLQIFSFSINMIMIKILLVIISKFSPVSYHSYLQSSMNFISVRSPDVLSKYFGQTEAAIRELFSRARAVAPCVLFFDDFDALAKRRYCIKY